MFTICFKDPHGRLQFAGFDDAWRQNIGNAKLFHTEQLAVEALKLWTNYATDQGYKEGRVLPLGEAPRYGIICNTSPDVVARMVNEFEKAGYRPMGGPIYDAARQFQQAIWRTLSPLDEL